MRQFKLYLSMLLLATFVMVGCSEDFDRPPMTVPQATHTANTTILELKTNYWNTAKNYIDTIGLTSAGDSLVIAGRVVSSDATGNIYKTLVIQDATAALAISINANSLYSTYRVGQEIVISATDLFIGKYNTLQQLGYPEWYASGNTWEASFMPLELFKAHAELNGLPNPLKVDTIATTISALPTTDEGLRKMQSQLVRFDDVKFTEANGTVTYATDDASTNRTIEDASGNTLNVRTSNYATFRSEKLPIGTGSVVGILSYYSGAWQLLIRSTSDCIGFSTNTEGMSADDPYTMDKVLEMQGSGKGGWMTGYIVGAVAPDVTTVTSNSDIQWEAPTVLANTLVIGTSPDTKDLANCVIVELPANSALRTAANLKDNADQYQKQIWINASLFTEVMGAKGLTTTGTAANYKLTGGATPGGDGAGSKDSPFSVGQVLNGTATGTTWVKGYIVGWINGKTIADGATFDANATVATNLLIADSPSETVATNCIPVQLPAGAVRTALNLQNNPANLGKAVSLYGSIETYFNATGLKSVTEYVLEGAVPPVVDTTPVTTLNETFASGIPASWTSKTVTGDKSWYNTFFQTDFYAAMTGYKGTTPPFDAWLITPALNVKDAATKILSFDTQNKNYNATTTVFEVYVLNSNDPSAATVKTKLNPALAPITNDSYSGWTNSGNLDLSSYGDKVYVGFRFHATADENYATWCVTNVKFGL